MQYGGLFATGLVVLACGPDPDFAKVPPRARATEAADVLRSPVFDFDDDRAATTPHRVDFVVRPKEREPRPPPVDDPCDGDGLPPGEYEVTITSGRHERLYDVYVPEEDDPSRPSPVVFYFHPLLTNKSYLKLARTRRKADQEGFIAIYPDGIESSWNAGACCGPANGAGDIVAVDDLGFVRDMVAAVKQTVCVDDRRIYAAGFSNGGFLSHRLACEASDLFAAIAPVSAVNGMGPAQCRPERAVPVFMINGTDDDLVPYGGGFSLRGVTNGTFISVDETTADWVERNECTTSRLTYRRGDTTCRTYDGCRDGVEVVQCTVDGGGHCWFGEPFCALGTNADNIDATDTTWAFLERFSL